MVQLFGRCLPIICLSRKKRQSLPICEQQTAGTKHHQEEINKLFVRRVESIRVTQQGAVCKRIPVQTVNERSQQHKKSSKKSKKEILNNNKNEKIIKPDDTEFDCETHISDRQSKQKNRVKSKKKSIPSSIKQKSIENNNTPSESRTPLEKLFNKTTKLKEPSPTPSSIIDIPEEEDHHHDTASTISSSSSTTSEWSTTTYPDSHSSEKSNDLIVNSIQRRQSMPLSNSTNRNDDNKHRSCVESFYLGREHVRQSTSPPSLSQTKIQEESNKNKRNVSAKSKQVLQNVRKMMKDQTIQEQHFNDTRQRESVRL
ncbi:unnamed protein product [Adineta steineri]|uniref:Uncharacterized protein n=1 Tax=Adineta steineri TaxID=433720 RepID=A0A813NJE9_9BILA|nr:unnamed protein product [Adineta steineri]CAF0736044.1 unnamed protein product [Adineta steineri]CAF0877571.1 unnamed protein product [Adineta steineri]CAF1271849.1 unnamed protein product [Adineta steineri]CAF3608549.1 unnamed protein product [Adineta steineri]